MVDKDRAGRHPYYYGVDLVRFLCAMMVTFFHLGFASWASPLFHVSYRMPSIEYLTQPGWVGVELFFVISGLVVASSAYSASGFTFLRGRILRLYPAVWICASLTFLVRAHSGVNRELVHSYANSILLLPVGSKIDGQYWTLVTEMIFYTMVLVAVISGNIRRISLLADGLALVSAAELAVIFLFPNAPYLPRLLAQPWNSMIRYGCHFAVGIYLWLWSQGRLRSRSAVFIILSLLSGLAEIRYGGLQGNKRIFAAVGHNFSTLTPMCIWMVGLALIVFSIAKRDLVNALPVRVLGVLRTMGLMTYPLYLVHFAVGRAALYLFVRLGVPPLMSLVAAVFVVSSVALVVCVWLEPRIRSRLRTFIDEIYGKLSVGGPVKDEA